MNKLSELGYTEIKPNLWRKCREDGIFIYHDFRKGNRWSYAFKDNDPIDVKELEEYKEIKALEEAKKCITLDKF